VARIVRVAALGTSDTRERTVGLCRRARAALVLAIRPRCVATSALSVDSLGGDREPVANAHGGQLAGDDLLADPRGREPERAAGGTGRVERWVRSAGHEATMR
jgi:hypothetical protein